MPMTSGLGCMSRSSTKVAMNCAGSGASTLPERRATTASQPPGTGSTPAISRYGSCWPGRWLTESAASAAPGAAAALDVAVAFGLHGRRLGDLARVQAARHRLVVSDD